MHSLTILTDHWGWQEEQLAGACAAQFKVTQQSVRTLSTVSDCVETSMGLPKGSRLPDVVFVRAIPNGSFEQITRRLSILHALQGAGVLVYNDARAIEMTIDKSATTIALRKAGLPQPRTLVTEIRDEASQFISEHSLNGQAVVIKPLFGNRGKGLRLVREVAELPAEQDIASVYYLQEFIGTETGATDWRVFVVGGKAIACMQRRGEGWITNRHQGGNCTAYPLNREFAELAEAATAAVGAHYAGVDLMRDRHGSTRILEVNGIPAWSGLQSVSEIRIAENLAQHLENLLSL